MDSITRNVTDLRSSERKAIEHVLGQTLSDDERVILQVEKAPRQDSARLHSAASMPAPRDEWEHRLRSIAIDCGISLSDVDVSSEGIYE